MCFREVQCRYEEDLMTTQSLVRWFEASSGTTLFYLYHLGLSTGAVSGGGKHISQLTLGNGGSPDHLIPVGVLRNDEAFLATQPSSSSCNFQCFPRTVKLNINYYQETKFQKRIISAAVTLDNFDYQQEKDDYTLKVEFQPLNYFELLINFAFADAVYVGFFVVVGIVSLVTVVLFWATNLVLSTLESIPKLKYFKFLKLVYEPCINGAVISLVPLWCIKLLFWAFIYLPDIYPQAFGGSYVDTGFYFLDGFGESWESFTPNSKRVDTLRFSRIGTSFMFLGIFLLVFCSRLYISSYISKEEQKIEDMKDVIAASRSSWNPTRWKRSTFIISGLFVGLFLEAVIEFSLWRFFPSYIWYFILAMNIVVGNIFSIFTESAVKDSLLQIPLDSSLGVIQGLVTFGASDLIDFILGYFIEFGYMLFDRLYLSPFLDILIETFTEYLSLARVFFINLALRLRANTSLSVDEEDQDTRESKDEERNSEDRTETGFTDRSDASGFESQDDTVEPILDSYAGYSTEAFGLVYGVNLVLLLLHFRTELVLPDLYNIRSQDMRIYLWFALVIVPFQLMCDVLILHALEVFHGWKVFDYLVYADYRYQQRDIRWKGFEGNLDECINEGKRTLDQMCFSEQYYFMINVMVSGIIYFALGVQILIRYEHNFFADPATGIIFVMLISTKLFLVVGDMFGVWKTKHEKTGWNEEDEIPQEDFEDMLPDGINREEYLMQQKLLDEKFRHKFLAYNKSWLLDKLPDILNPTAVRRSRPYLLNQIAKILGRLQEDDSDEEVDIANKFDEVALTASQRAILRLWHMKAQRQALYKQLIQPVLNRNKKQACEGCLSQNTLNVLVCPDFEKLIKAFEEKLGREEDTAEINEPRWREFFKSCASFRTVCLKCNNTRREQEHFETSYQPYTVANPSQSFLLIVQYWKLLAKKSREQGGNVAQRENSHSQLLFSPALKLKQMALNQSTQQIILKWIQKARKRRPDKSN
eukprot:maker-scaffold_29-snap-gene-4.0-mRNA-1 protein AED:0.04 eAED:0.07 QI:0/0/0/1/0/0.5/2/0/983